MEVKWYGHAAFFIKGEEGIRVITDPYQPGAYGGGIAYGPIGDEADVVTVSHDHDDHNWTKGLPGSPQVVKGPGRHQVKGKVFEGIATYHDPSRGSERGENTIFCFEVDGIRVCHLGDLGHVLGHQEVEAIGKVDLLLIPVGGFYTIDAGEASRVVEQLRPKKVIPMHFKTPKCNFPISGVEAFLQGKEGVRRVGSSTVTLTPEDFERGFEILVLEHAL
ncbi:MAG: MBL fold metallo-hydrolase [Deltaproteobacteria bacterium]|nr:MAG: MBL fold metallo-hydrolase [Deltaproteobacteria bacterium]